MPGFNPCEMLQSVLATLINPLGGHHPRIHEIRDIIIELDENNLISTIPHFHRRILLLGKGQAVDEGHNLKVFAPFRHWRCGVFLEIVSEECLGTTDAIILLHSVFLKDHHRQESWVDAVRCDAVKFSEGILRLLRKILVKLKNICDHCCKLTTRKHTISFCLLDFRERYTYAKVFEELTSEMQAAINYVISVNSKTA